MKDVIIFDLEKIKENTRPIGQLQAMIAELEEVNNEFEEMVRRFSQIYEDKELSKELPEVLQILQTTKSELLRISKENVKKYLIFQDNLIKKYKEALKGELIDLELTNRVTKAIGLSLIETKGISKVIEKISFISSITQKEWLELLDSLELNSLFIKSINKVRKNYEKYQKTQYNIELSKIPNNITPEIIKKFESVYFNENPLTFSEFLINQKKTLSQEELKAREKFLERTQEEERIKSLKRKQEQQQKSFQEYFELSEKEFERRRRKKRREKLSDLTLQSKNSKKVEISEEVSEKIEKFKSQLENGFKDKFIYQKDLEKDPIDIIRERKKRKDKEYKKYVKKFKNFE